MNQCGQDDWYYGPKGPPTFPVTLGPFNLPTYQDCTVSLQSATDDGLIICGEIETTGHFVDGNATKTCGTGSVISTRGNTVFIFAGH